ncbi:hypothetical protein Z945_1973 [Sulfitobacter noctilucae]|nr:hypothetical protein Z945_1973 [Sulfitobacter noctilucae]
MADRQIPPETVTVIHITSALCDVQAGPLRCVVELSSTPASEGLKAIWRNEVGSAAYTHSGIRA